MKIELLDTTPLPICSTAVRTCWQSFDKSDSNECCQIGCIRYENRHFDPECLNCEFYQGIGDGDKALIDRVGNKFKHRSTMEHVKYNFFVEDININVLIQLLDNKYVFYNEGLLTINTRSFVEMLEEGDDFKDRTEFLLSLFDKYIMKEHKYLLEDHVSKFLNLKSDEV